jgi:hypothetical protein
MNSARVIAPQIGIAAACLGLGVARATFYRAQRPVSVPQANVPRASSPRALSVPEQHTILEWLHEPTYADLSPRTVFAMLLDAGRYLAGLNAARCASGGIPALISRSATRLPGSQPGASTGSRPHRGSHRRCLGQATSAATNRLCIYAALRFRSDAAAHRCMDGLPS